MPITPDELTRLRLYESEIRLAQEKFGTYKRYLAVRCDHPADWHNRIKGWRTCDYDICDICGMGRSVGSQLWYSRNKRWDERDD